MITFFIILDLNDFEIAKVRKKVIEFIEILYLCKLKKEYAMTFKEILRKLNNRYIYATLAFLVVILFIDQFKVSQITEIQAEKVAEGPKTADRVLRKRAFREQTIPERLAERHRDNGKSGPRAILDETRQRGYLSN